MEWEIKKRKADLKKPILIEGLPGMGNVGKIAVDFLIDELKAKKISEFHSFYMPNSVLVTQNNTVKLPKLEIYHAKHKKQDYLFLAGDTQPAGEKGSYTFCTELIKLLKEYDTQFIITLGGIGLPNVPTEPKVYCTGAKKAVIKEFSRGLNIKTSIHGIVGPIMGVTGLLLTLTDIKSVTLLAETFAHPLYYGVHGAKEILQRIKDKYKLNINLKHIEKEIEKIKEPEEYPADCNDKITYIG